MTLSRAVFSEEGYISSNLLIFILYQFWINEYPFYEGESDFKSRFDAEINFNSFSIFYQEGFLTRSLPLFLFCYPAAKDKESNEKLIVVAVFGYKMMKNRSSRTASTFSNSTNEEEGVRRSIRDLVVVLSEDDYDDASSFCSSVVGSIDISGHSITELKDHSSLPIPIPPLSTPPPPLATPSTMATTTPSPRRKARSRPKKGPGRTERQASSPTTPTDQSCVSESRWDCASTKDFMPTVSPGIHRKRPATICFPKGTKCRDVPLLTASLVASRSRSLALSPRAPQQSKGYEGAKKTQEVSPSKDRNNKCRNKRREKDDLLASSISPISADNTMTEYVQTALFIVKNENSLSPQGRRPNKSNFHG
jgi:hypothetical protein